MATGEANAIGIDLIGCINAGRQVLFVIKKGSRSNKSSRTFVKGFPSSTFTGKGWSKGRRLLI